MFFSRLRDEIKFSSKEMLISQLKKDEIRVKIISINYLLIDINENNCKHKTQHERFHYRIYRKIM